VKKILVVDDDRTTRHMIALQLRSAGYAVEAVSDGRRALERVRRHSFDLVLLDVWMPGMDGLELLGRLREEPSRPRVVVMTADDTSETLLRAIRQRAYRFVAKPVEPAQLVEIVRSVLAAGPEVRPIEVVSARPDWVELVVPCDREAAERIQEFLAHLDADLPADVRAGVGQAFRELLMNAIEWGGKLDPTKTVRISCLRARRMLLYRIADPGQGFRFEGLAHSALANPPDRPTEHMAVREEKGLRPGGFGLLMTRQMVDELLYNEAQNEVVFVKYLD
jgi:CheY-like chemotaxis protein/anti-sigma regulatory factor (Ser/Thr protein kinase)